MTGGPVAIVDCGTNTIRLLIAESDGRGGLRELDRRMEIVRLGQGVDATGSFLPEALQRTFAATERYAGVITEHGVDLERIRFVATSASRDVSNREEFFAGISTRLGVIPQVITGDEEARLSFAGALSGANEPAGPVLVTDIGGGSTELIIGNAAGEPSRGISLDIGSVRITERFWSADPPTVDDRARATRLIDELLDDSGIAFSEVRTWIGVAGTLTTLAAIDLDLADYDRTLVHGHRVGRDRVTAIAAALAASSSEQIRGRNGVHPQRADVITAGALIAGRIGSRLMVDALIVSESDILDGAALDLLRAAGAGQGA
ncbi:Ppx/GppA phosphatase family protein [Microlunatus soli]|uniref:Exopolyphosphatase / guanosine-5'-triphosphate,3'-diphosphate pyrophosphatase n=1 Tax=Microlunatus soli TaxID=630515 RepID=A0A1H1QVK1_9ACTN|nr:Ppx/GppA phosphatase family protein [Microlunatus soli]SDS27508.1 exopolyphosphatase / guanosine-5'-triphosphate,3'-diphosphate pyrophosphatase [Microlunatus soli]